MESMSRFRSLALRIGLRRVEADDIAAWERAAETARIIHAASDPRRRIRLSAVRALARIGDRDSVGALRSALRGRSRSVALAAAAGIRRHDPKAAADTVEWWEAVETKPQSPSSGKLIDKSKMERFAAFKAQVLGQAGKGRFY